MKTICIAILSAALLLPACAGGELQDNEDTDGRVTSRGDAGRETRDTGTGSVRDLGTETMVDVVADGGSDVPATDADRDSDSGDTNGELTEPWAEIPEGTPAPVADAIRASRAAMLRHCECCNSRYASDPNLCLSEFNDGGFEPDQCALDALALAGTTAEGYLGCLVGAYVELTACNSECGTGCTLCENNFTFAITRCEGDYPSVATGLGRCP